VASWISSRREEGDKEWREGDGKKTQIRVRKFYGERRESQQVEEVRVRKGSVETQTTEKRDLEKGGSGKGWGERRLLIKRKRIPNASRGGWGEKSREQREGTKGDSFIGGEEHVRRCGHRK